MFCCLDGAVNLFLSGDEELQLCLPKADQGLGLSQRSSIGAHIDA